ncbi:glycosyltransferase family 39 protein, partial [Salmonella sp. SAL4452]|uniref:glycosyltransferase family 39 protein n=1 Tax=Salmonella sp. SAL4452 TaxID=3159907 RepID=UPI0039799147
NGYANQFYSAAMQAGAHSWRAWLWGASDWPGVITVDKPQASLWIPSLFIRIFGLNSWSVLLPEALMGVATVYVVYRITL